MICHKSLEVEIGLRMSFSLLVIGIYSDKIQEKEITAP